MDPCTPFHPSAAQKCHTACPPVKGGDRREPRFGCQRPEWGFSVLTQEKTGSSGPNDARKRQDGGTAGRRDGGGRRTPDRPCLPAAGVAVAACAAPLQRQERGRKAGNKPGLRGTPRHERMERSGPVRKPERKSPAPTTSPAAAGPAHDRCGQGAPLPPGRR